MTPSQSPIMHRLPVSKSLFGQDVHGRRAFVAAGVLDCIENFGMLALLRASSRAPPEGLGRVAFLMTFASMAKWVLLAFCAPYAAWMAARALRAVAMRAAGKLATGIGG